MSSPHRHQQATTRISHINGRSKNKVSHASISVLMKCCKKHPNAAKAIFVSILFSWVAFVALFISKIQHNDHNRLVTMSPLHARDNHAHHLREHTSMMNAANDAKAKQEKLSHHDKQHQQRDMSSYGKSSKEEIPISDKKRNNDIDVHTKKRITSYLLSKLPGYKPDSNAPILPDEPWKNMNRQNNQGRKHFRDMFHKHVDAEDQSSSRKNRKNSQRKKHDTKQIEEPKQLPESMQQSPRDRIAGEPMSKVGLPSSKDHQNNAQISFQHSNQKKLKFTKLDIEGNDDDDDEIESRHQYTQNALESSTSYAQTFTDKSPYGAQGKDAFAPKQYFEKPTIGDDFDTDFDTYYSTDDDIVRGTGYTKWPNGKEPVCSTPTFYRLYKPTCNELHSVASGYDWLKGDKKSKHHRSRYLASGTYRQVFVLERRFASDERDEVILKSMKRFKGAYNADDTGLYDDMRKDSMVMEQLSASPRIADIYAFCGLSSIIEYAPENIEKYVLPTGGVRVTNDDDDESDDEDDPTPVNHIKAQEKLEMAIELAKGIATMHGHKDGVIANVDVQIGQFCRGNNGMIKILDFNRAEVMLYDESYGGYCRFENGVPPDGSLRAPEEIIDAPLTEKIDVYCEF